MISKLI